MFTFLEALIHIVWVLMMIFGIVFILVFLLDQL